MKINNGGVKMDNRDIIKNTEDELLKLLKRGIEKAIRTFYKNDSYLIDNKLHEMAITHRIAIYLDNIFSEYNVDCEWNKNFLDKKVFSVTDFIKDFNYNIERIITQNKQISFKINQIDDLMSNKNTWEEFSDYVVLTLLETESKGEIIIKQLRPDIIIHKRGLKQNIAVIEVKREFRSVSASKQSSDKLFDLVKLYALTTDKNFLYDYGFYIELPKSNSGWKNIFIEKNKILSKVFGEEKNKVFEIKFTNKN